MTSCDKCQVRLLALLDNETTEEELRLGAAHLQGCHACRAFCLDTLRIRQQFDSAPVPHMSAVKKQTLIASIRGDQNNSKGLQVNPSSKQRRHSPRLRRLGQWAAIIIIGLSWALGFGLNREITDLRAKLRVTEQHIVQARQEDELKTAQKKQQKAISALYFRMQELEDRVDRSDSPRPTFFPTKRNGL
jgi:hypothetical protein